MAGMIGNTTAQTLAGRAAAVVAGRRQTGNARARTTTNPIATPAGGRAPKFDRRAHLRAWRTGFPSETTRALWRRSGAPRSGSVPWNRADASAGPSRTSAFPLECSCAPAGGVWSKMRHGRSRRFWPDAADDLQVQRVVASTALGQNVALASALSATDLCRRGRRFEPRRATFCCATGLAVD